MQAKEDLQDYLNNSLINKLVVSPVPLSCKQRPCILGIDEAGRGPVLGPMTYAVAYYPENLSECLAKMKFADSKTLTESTRDKLFESIGKEGFTNLGYIIKILSPNMISNSMLRRNKYNLNALSHDTAIDLIRQVQERGVKVSHVFLDAVGPTDKYKVKLQSHFRDVKFTVANKADSLYPIVSAASVCAKVMRDRIVENWKFLESSKLRLETFERGSGYPSDPITKKFLVDVLDPIFGFPTLARFSWSTVSKILDDKGASCDWNEPDEDEANTTKSALPLSKQALMMRNFFKVRPSAKNAKNSSSTSLGEQKMQAKNNIVIGKRTNATVFYEERLLSKVSCWPES